MSLLEKDKRKFSVIIGSKKCGACSGASPSGAARKVKGKRSEFYLKETTKGSKKKLYGPYSSKKKVVQRGGEEKTLKEHICDTVLKILNNCDKLDTFDSEMNRINNLYRILDNTYLFLGINHRQDKYTVLKEIIRMRNNYFTKDGREFPLCYCLCSLDEKDDREVEILFCYERKLLINKRLNKSTDFYTNNWSKLIKFLRITIRRIELEILEQNRKNTQRLKGIKNELNKEQQKRNKEENDYFAQLRSEIEKAKALHAAQAGPAEEEPNSNDNSSIRNPKPPSYLLTTNELRDLGINPNGSFVANSRTNLSQIPQRMLQAVGRRRNFTPTQPLHNNKNPPTRNLAAELAALLNNNNSQKPQASTNNENQRRHNELVRKLAALKND